jgi:ABC-type branched-subunit amino acid transport system ATPase component
VNLLKVSNHSMVERIAVVIAQERAENGLTVLLVEQNLEVIYMISEHCIVMEKGIVVANHSPTSSPSRNSPSVISRFEPSSPRTRVGRLSRLVVMGQLD